MERVWLALGSNLLKPLYQVRSAIEQLSRIPQIRLIACSSFYRSKPFGLKNQPDFLNAVVIIDTTFVPENLLDYIQWIELQHGRIRKENRFGPRTLDIDILLFGARIITNNRLTIPHYDMRYREFILYPLYEISPELQFPDDGVFLADLIRLVPSNGLVYWHNDE